MMPGSTGVVLCSIVSCLSPLVWYLGKERQVSFKELLRMGLIGRRTITIRKCSKSGRLCRIGNTKQLGCNAREKNGT